jgi:hypothetical protein
MPDHPIRRLAWWLDDAFRIPGTQQRVGFDALIGLIPGVGDTIGAVFSTYIIIEAARRGASVWTVARMLGNVGVETVFGAIPLLGDLFDVVFKANQRNLALLGDTLERNAPSRGSARRPPHRVGADRADRVRHVGPHGAADGRSISRAVRLRSRAVRSSTSHR